MKYLNCLLIFVVHCEISGPMVAGTKPDSSVDLNSILSHVNQLEAELHSTMTALQANMDDLQSTKTELQVTRSQLQANFKSTKNELQTTKSELQATKSELQVLKSKQENDVAFQVTLRVSGSTGWTTLKFDTVDYNKGGGYNKTSGMFTAPVLGTYIFWANVRFDTPVTWFYVYIYKGQQHLASGFYQKNAAVDLGVASTMTITHLDKGDQIHFTTHSTSAHIEGFGDSSYGGALLHSI